MPAHTWQSLAAATLRRQFPGVADASRSGAQRPCSGGSGRSSRRPRGRRSSRPRRGCPASRTRRSSAAYEALDIVRSTSLRGTVHTSLRGDHGALDALARRTSMNLWCRTLKLSAADVTRLRSRIEDFTAEGWLPHADLYDRVMGWLAAEGFDPAIAASRDGVGFALYRGHSALLRKTTDRRLAPAGHLRLPLGGPSSSVTRRRPRRRAHPADSYRICRRSGRRPGATSPGGRATAYAGSMPPSVASVTSSWPVPGPDGHDYLDLADPPASGAGDPGVRLLPEYDALLLGYAPTGRARFADPRAISFSWNRANGVHAPTVLADGQAAWDLAAAHVAAGAPGCRCRWFPASADFVRRTSPTRRRRWVGSWT